MEFNQLPDAIKGKRQDDGVIADDIFRTKVSIIHEIRPRAVRGTGDRHWNEIAGVDRFARVVPELHIAVTGLLGRARQSDRIDDIGLGTLLDRQAVLFEIATAFE